MDLYCEYTMELWDLLLKLLKVTNCHFNGFSKYKFMPKRLPYNFRKNVYNFRKSVQIFSHIQTLTIKVYAVKVVF